MKVTLTQPAEVPTAPSSPRRALNLILGLAAGLAVGFVAAASLGCRFATAYRALTAHGRLTEGRWLAVHGCGGVGMSAVMIGVALVVLVASGIALLG